ncbi:hypothetical protein ABZ807_02725 [Micromonospora sp. NPDC047548]|uniref:hypothetical protein n=1 Tax=Micromonospora sp. NPDC047548 TaxID=3155624 RepID=UPI0033EED238
MWRNRRGLRLRPLRRVRNKLSDLVLHQRNRKTLNQLSDIATRQQAAERGQR